MCHKHWIFKAVTHSKVTMAVANSAIFVTNEESQSNFDCESPLFVHFLQAV